MGRSARGVKGIVLASKDDAVVGMMTVDSEAQEMNVLSVTERGYGKRSPLEEYRRQGRGGKGIITMKTTDRNGPVVAIHRVSEGDELMVMTKRGVVIRMSVDGISTMGRNTQGVKLINLDSGDEVASVAPIAVADDDCIRDRGAYGELRCRTPRAVRRDRQDRHILPPIVVWTGGSQRCWARIGLRERRVDGAKGDRQNAAGDKRDLLAHVHLLASLRRSATSGRTCASPHQR
jgi:hypothetical protein